MALVKCNHCNKETKNDSVNCILCGKILSENLRKIKDKKLTEKETELKRQEKAEFMINVIFKKKI